MNMTSILLAANTFLLAVSAYFVKEFVSDVRKLTERVNTVEKDIVELQTTVKLDREHHE